jgi:hypothetical protein
MNLYQSAPFTERLNRFDLTLRIVLDTLGGSHHIIFGLKLNKEPKK